MKLKVCILLFIAFFPFIEYALTGNSFVLPEKKMYCVIDENDKINECFIIQIKKTFNE